MGIIRKTLGTGALTTFGVVTFLASDSKVVYPLPGQDPIWRSDVYRRYNPNGNPSTQDTCIKRIPVSAVRPDLLQREGALVTEFCRGVWAGWGYGPQRYMSRKHLTAETASQLWGVDELARSDYAVGTRLSDHFEVVGRTAERVTVRCGDTPRNAGPRESDGLFEMGARVLEGGEQVELELKSVFFRSRGRVEGIQGPMPTLLEEAHRWYARVLMASGSRWVLK